MADAEPSIPRKPRKVKASAMPQRVGPAEINDPALRGEVRRAAVWIGMAAALALTVYLAEPLLIIFGGMVFAAMIDGGARLLGRVLKIGRLWRVTIVLVASALVVIWLLRLAPRSLAAAEG